MKLVSESSADTEEIGLRLGRRLKAGDVVALYGDLGAGKTTLVRGIAQAFGIPARDVTSASFTIIAEYESNPPFFHIDLYRVEGAEDAEQAGLWECAGSRSVAVIEWAEKLAQELTKDFKKVHIINIGDERREIITEGFDEEDRNNL